MTVKTLTPDQKQGIARLYKDKICNQKDLAQQYGVSERTIARVLAELEVHSALPRMTKEAYQAQLALEAAGISFAALPGLLNGLKRLGITITNNGAGVIGIGVPETKPDNGLNTIEQIDAGGPWRVGEYWSSARRGSKVLVLSQGIQQIKEDGAHKDFIRWVAGSNITSKPVTKEQVVEFTMSLPEEEFGVLHSQIITARVARASNTHVQTAMLNLQQKVESNARDSEQLRKK